MTESNVRQIMMSISEKLPKDKVFYLKDKLTNAPDEKVNEILMCNLYNPTHILLFSFFLGSFGVDRFMLGDTGLGIAKLLLGWATCGIWPIADIFMSSKRAKEKNFEKIMMLL